MPEEQNTHPPKTVAEIGVHISYISEDLREIKQSLSDSPKRKEFDTLTARVTLLEQNNDKIKSSIAKWAITILVSMLLAQYGLDKFI